MPAAGWQSKMVATDVAGRGKAALVCQPQLFQGV
jgi:hypothetical protein